MGHCIRAVIAERLVISSLASRWIDAHKIELTQGFSLVKVSDQLLDSINQSVNNQSPDPYQEFYYLSSSLNEILIQESNNSILAYIETDYFGGVGTQAALLYENGIASTPPLKTQDLWNVKAE